MLHSLHIDYSQMDDRNVLDDPKITEKLLAPYMEYGKLVKPGRV